MSAAQEQIIKPVLDGFLILDKPKAQTSNRALQYVKRLLKVKKAGHTGTLDPLATGVLPLCLGQATKFSRYLLNSDKTYLVSARLGITTTTGDADGEILAEQAVAPEVSATLMQSLAQFEGDIQQTPPMYSAIKYQGKPLYQWARQGMEVARKPRSVTIYQLDLLHQSESGFTLRVCCSKGTYIRTLVEDIGRVLGCGAHINELRRVQVGRFVLQDSITLEQLEQIVRKDISQVAQLLSPLDVAIDHWPKINLSASESNQMQCGQVLERENLDLSKGWVRLYLAQNSHEPKFLGIAEVLPGGQVQPRRMLSTADIKT